MMKLTNKQQQEIDFLCKTWKVNPTQEHIEEYVNYTSCGIGSISKGSTNPLFQAKRGLDMMVKMWRADMKLGIISRQELKDDFNCPFADKMVDSIWKSLKKEWCKALDEIEGKHKLELNN